MSTLDNTNCFYVYALLDPRKLYAPFYIGKGSGDRAWSHLKKFKSSAVNPRKAAVIKRIREAGLEPVVLIWEDELAEERAYFLERELITRFGRRGYDEGGILTNLCPDGRPPKRSAPCSDTTRAKIAAGNRGKKRSSEVRAQMSASRRGVTRNPLSQETREKIRQGNLGTKRPPQSTEWRARQSAFMKELWRQRRETLSLLNGDPD